MKNLTPLFLFVFLFSSCYNYYTYSDYNDLVREKPMFTNIPMIPSEEKVEVYFPGEKIPEEPYIKVDIIEVSGNNSTKQSIARLQALGAVKGVDALIIMSNSTSTEDDGVSIYTSQNMSALGIKFIKNIDYIDECVHRLNVIALDEKTNKYDTATVIKTDWRGELTDFESGNKKYWHFLFQLSLRHLVLEKNASWKYQTFPSSNGFEKTQRVHTAYSNGNGTQISTTMKTVEFKTRGNLVHFIKVSNNHYRDYSGTIVFKYDKNGDLVEKDIVTKKIGRFKQKFVYSDRGVPLRIDVYKVDKKGNEKFYFKGVYETYEKEDLRKMLEEEKVQ